ncbi:MAG: DNA mismatch repair endonuclease MutL [Rickettsiales bacterium]|nr:DNA mismatch repair endonuclease MutL [Rickettsiales bacterium]
MPIRVLSPVTVNRIAAGEVIERPSSVVKELVENSIDSGATQIDVVIHNGGRNYISVTDNGSGIAKDELAIAIERHATSKLADDSNLLKITALGFRGEALPSIGSVSRLKITSQHQQSNEAWSIEVIGGETQEIYPAQTMKGTKIEVRDLFFATPVRIKFLKSERTENQHIVDIVSRLAMVNPHIAFSVSSDVKSYVSLKAAASLKERLAQMLDQEFIDNATYFEETIQGMTLKGFAALPTYNRGTSSAQFMFVNQRPVKDKLIMGSIRAAYQDFLARDRYPVVVMYLDVPLEDVDVNVHPTKAEVRFRDTNTVRSAIIRTLKSAINASAHQAATTNAEKILETAVAEGKDQMQPMNARSFQSAHAPSYPRNQGSAHNYSMGFDQQPHQISEHAHANEQASEYVAALRTQADALHQSSSLMGLEPPSANAYEHETPIESGYDDEGKQRNFPMGVARCQVHQNYIISQTLDGMIIIDQHAVHERIIYEQMKAAIKTHGIKRQLLLIPEIIELNGEDYDIIQTAKSELEQLGISYDVFGEHSIVVRELPAMIQCPDVRKLIQDIIDDIKEFGDTISLKERIEDICGAIACHSSIRSGRRLNLAEMNALLRQMEETPHTGQCNHGRPTYVSLELEDIEKLFGRK